jgi:hypothetical protein
MGWTQAENDVADVMIWLRCNHGREVSYADIAAAGNARSIARKEFETMAKAADECITKVAGLDKVGPQVVRQENTSLLAQMIADLEARLTDQRQADQGPPPLNDQPGAPS